MNRAKKVSLILLLLRICTPLHARGWSSCNESVGCCAFREKPLVSEGKKYDVIPLGYPYGNDRSSRPYLAPFAHPSPYEFGQPFTFGYVAVESTGVRKSKHEVKNTQACKDNDEVEATDVSQEQLEIKSAPAGRRKRKRVCA